MARININIGTNANDGTGDDLRTAMQKINTNFAELYGTTAEANDLIEDTSPQLGGNLDLQNYIITTSITNGSLTLSPNGTGNLVLGALRVNGTTVSSDDSSKITLAEAVDVTGILTASTVHVNLLQSDDSTAIQINDSVNMSGTLNVKDLIVNEISSEDSSAIEIKDKLNVSGTLTAPFIATNGIFSNDSSEIQFGNSISTAGTVSATSISTNTISSPDSTRVNVDDSLQISGALYVNSIQSDDSTAVQINDGLNINGELSLNNNKIINVQDPVANQDAATKNYVDTQVISASSLTIVGDDSSGTVFTAGETVKFEGQGTTNVTVSGDTVYINSTGSIPPITFVGDDSTGTAVNVGETLKIAGNSNITTAVSGDTLTITGPNLSSYLTNSPITIVGDDSTGSTINTAETLKFTGGNNITTSVVNDVVTITGTANINVNEISSTDSSAIQVNDSINVSETLTSTSVIADTYLTRNLQLETATNEIINITVTVVTKSTLNKWYGQGSASCYLINGTQSPYLNFQRGKIYRFNQTDSSNSGHPINIYYDEYKSRAFPDFSGSSSYVTQVGTAGTSGAYTELYVDFPSRGQLFYQCQNHAYMGGIINIAGQGDPIQFVSDDSSGFYVGGNESVKFAGGNSIDTIATQDATDTITIALSNAITVNEISSSDSTAIQINDGLNVSGTLSAAGTLSADVLDVNEISSSDSSAIQINSAVNISGILTTNNNLIANNLITNEISSSDSTAIQINDAVNVSGVLSTNVLDVNEISSADSSAIQINDSVNITGNLSVDSMDVNSLTSTDSSQLIVTDNFRVDGYLQANQLVGDVITLGSVGTPISGSQTVDFNLCTTADIWINDTTTTNFTNGVTGTRKIVFVHNTAGSNKSFTFQANGVPVATETIGAGITNVYEAWLLSYGVYYVLLGTTI